MNYIRSKSNFRLFMEWAERVVPWAIVIGMVGLLFLGAQSAFGTWWAVNR